ncbi:NADPH-dependent F420 reductase [Arthrobacter sp. NPDC090010]|uniref:NADPH-dependent F420 reductase n=1 Tax=Arthrobacter sp. NPDC090010 TaxID=3363942 RepID=UPI0037FE504D
MNIAVLGTGVVGRTLSARLCNLGHHVILGTRDPETTRDDENFKQWHAQNPSVGIGHFSDAAAQSEVIVVAVGGVNALDVLSATGRSNLEGKVLWDVSNPLDFSKGFPPTLFVKDTDSLAESIQREYPAAKLVKALNTMSSIVMVNTHDLAAEGTTFLCGADSEAKNVVGVLLAQLGHQDVLDLGDVTAARGMEMVLPLWLRVMGALGGPEFNFKIVRASGTE